MVGTVWYDNHYSGGSDSSMYRDEVYSWTEEGWVEVGKIKKGREYHAVSTILMDDEITRFCK